MSVRNGTAATGTTAAEERGPIGVLPHAFRAHQGSAEITVWCPKCEERVIPLRTGLCGWCDTQLDAEQPAPEPAEAAVPPRTPAARDAVAAREDTQVALWRRNEIFEWALAEGPQTIAHIAAHFQLANHVARCDIDQLRAEGRLERTGVKRPGPNGGRSSVEFRAIDPISHALTGDAEAQQPAAEAEGLPPGPSEAPPGDAADIDRTIEAGHHDEQGEPAAVGREVAAPITIHEQLVVRYIGSLIGWVERSSIVRDQGPPDHVYDRIERLLQIQDGAA